MSSFSQNIIDDVKRTVRIVYLDRSISHWWNTERRGSEDTRIFCGWYWIAKGGTREEAGPFRTWSSAVRDAHYRLVLRRDVPLVGYSALKGAKQQ
jgi:hypothetical protein